ncbi:MAG: AmmeMemoRadiSam system protein B [Defluviitaleaceae bacterium]|nr:AmmeMemoRadiSam system protein B [Defluviitaleaceae bacterium]
MKKYFAVVGIFIAFVLVIKALGTPEDVVQAPVRDEVREEVSGETGDEVMHGILHMPHDVFLFSTMFPREYNVSGHIYAGVVPHHITAATMISGFFYAASAFEYDLVVIVAPNHEGGFAPVILSYRDWDIGEGVFSHSGFVADMMDAGINAAVSHSHMESDHSVGIFIPYIYYYLPGVAVAPMLLNRSLSFDDTLMLYYRLEEWIAESGLNVLLVASVDFSHFLTPSQAAERDRVTMAAILAHELEKIHTLSDYYLDSPAAMIIFLKYLRTRGLDVNLADHTCAAEFLGQGLEETTSYKIIIGAREGMTRLTFVGDIMLHEAQLQGCFDHAFALVAPILHDADLAIGNLETTFSGFFSCFPLFSAPDEFGHALRRAGFDLLSTANNHALDHGVDGLLRTLDFLDELGIDSFGTYRNRDERDSVLIREINGIHFAFLAYTFCTGANNPPLGREYLINLMGTGMLDDIKKARSMADIVIVTPHMGNEYELFVRQEFRDVAMLMLQAGADVVVANHPHVVQPMGFAQVENPDGTTRKGFVAYCLGNFISSQREIPTETGVILNLYFTKNGLQDSSLIPTWVKFVNASGEPYIQILPLPTESQNLRHQDQIRVREAYSEVAYIRGAKR